MNVSRLISFFFLLLPAVLLAQNPDFVILKQIYLHGNNRTHDRIILRELDINEGDTIYLAHADTILRANRNRIYNTKLFNEIKLTLLPDSGHYNILLIEVTERWYIFPIPIFELADRSFNEWWYNQNRNLNRVNYGIQFSDKNFRGRKEELTLILKTGFTTKLGLNYTIPYLNKKQTWGMNLEATYDQNKQVSFKTEGNKQKFLKDEYLMRERIRAGFTVFLRKSFFGTHAFSLRFNQTHVADTIKQLNPNYFLNGAKNQRFFQLGYEFEYDERDVRAYALKGYFLDLTLTQNGLTNWEDIHYTTAEISFAQYKSLGHNFFFASLTKGKAYFPDKVPYFNMAAFGYGQDYVRGYDLYVIDAMSIALQRTTIRKKLYERELIVKSFLPIKEFSKIPIAIYLNTYYDVGLAYSPNIYPGNTLLSNELLRGGGVGMDIVTYYDSVIRFEYSFNKMLEHKLYIAFTKDI